MTEPLVKRPLSGLLGVALALGAAELYVRPTYTISNSYDPGFGYINTPHTASRWRLEGNGHASWGDHGTRLTPGAEVAHRVLVLGDSFTEAVMLDDDEVFPAVTQTVMRRRGLPLELLNAGRSSLGAADYVALATRYRERWHPRWTVIEVVSNDLAEDSWTATHSRFERSDDGRLHAVEVVPPARSGIGAKLFDLRQKSMFVGYGSIRYGRFRAMAEKEPPLFRASMKRPPPAKPMTPPVEEELDLLVAAYSGRITLLYLSAAKDEADPIEERAREYCAAHGTSCVFTRDDFRALRSRGDDPYGFSNTQPGVGHMNAAGHRVAGTLLAAELERLAPTIADARP